MIFGDGAMEGATRQEIDRLIEKANEKQLKVILDFLTRLSKTFT
jgi:hypothetical protein